MSEFQDDFELAWHGNTVLITPAHNVETMSWDLIEQAAEIVMAPLNEQEVPMVVVDLSSVSYFGSVFLALLLATNMFVAVAANWSCVARASWHRNCYGSRRWTHYGRFTIPRKTHWMLWRVESSGG